MKKRKDTYRHGFACYGFPVDLKVTAEFDVGVWREGKRKRLCAQCIPQAVEVFEKFLRKFAREGGKHGTE